MHGEHGGFGAAKPEFHDSGSLDACSKCENVSCCGRKGWTITPPYLTSRDVARIAQRTGLEADNFSDVVMNPHTGNAVRFLKASAKEGCHFLEAGKCKIHDSRPVDCRLFPLDMKQIGGELKWVIYNYQHCELSERDTGLLVEQIAPALDILAGELLDYATVPLPAMTEIKYKVLMPVAIVS